MLSIDSQISEIRKQFSSRSDITIVEIFEEAQSAKKPGRKIFDDMLRRIEKGEAEGIIAWHPDRLARNSIDGGRVIFLLDQGKLKDMHFSTFSFENNSQGKFMLSIIFGYSKYYVDNLSENVKRGNRTKVEKGWKPSKAPVGYLNHSEDRTIIIDPERFELVRRMWDLLLSQGKRPSEIWRIARYDWGLTTKPHKHAVPKLLSLSYVYAIFHNIFYAGLIPWEGRVHQGKHPPMITLDEFNRAQTILGRPSKERPKRHAFAFTGMIRCGACGQYVTAEHKVNRFGSTYDYYHCTHRKRPKCTERSVEVRNLVAQIQAFLDTIKLPQGFHGWSLQELDNRREETRKLLAKTVASVADAIKGIEQKASTLIDMRVRNLIDDDEFTKRRKDLDMERHRLEQRRQNDDEKKMFEPVREVISFIEQAKSWFENGDDEAKRLVFQIVGSNPILENKKLSVEAKKPFCIRRDLEDFPLMCAFIEEVGTLVDDEEFQNDLARIRRLREKFSDDPEGNILPRTE